MNNERTVFSQILDFIPMHQFRTCVNRYNGNHRVKSFSCFDQYLTMAFAQLTYRESLRDIETCLNALQGKLYHCGFRGKVSRNNLANSNEKRDWRIYHDFAQVLISKARQLYANEDFGVTLKNTVYALDATVIDLCLSLFPWAQHRRHKSAIKLHTLMDLKGSIPTFVRITSGAVHETTIFPTIPLEASAIYVMDKGYTDFETLYSFSKSNCFFIIRAKRNTVYYRRCSHPIDKSSSIRSDQTIQLTGPKTSRLYPIPLRRITFRDEEQHRTFVFLTNHFQLDALTICQLYKLRWQIELFFKWIKQHLRIKSFFGTSINAVKTQIWIAISVYVLVAIIKKELKLERSLHEILQIISVLLFEKTPLKQALTENYYDFKEQQNYNQLSLFNL
ncbi:MAG: IS4 family transposase [Planctomycetaceae bacterium]|nr:IS4 family transposase [Planctomycetaceae bacterium]